MPWRALKSGSGSSGRSAHGDAKVRYSCSGEFRFRPSVVRSVPIASVVGSGWSMRSTFTWRKTVSMAQDGRRTGTMMGVGLIPRVKWH